MRNTYLLIAIVLTTTPLFVAAEEFINTPNTDTTQNNLQSDERNGEYGSRSLGFSAGAIGGIGINYRRFLASKHGYQIGGMAFGDKNDVGVNIGGQYMYTLDENLKGSRFYALVGAGTFWNGSKPPSYDDVNNKTTDAKWHWDQKFNLGTGLGIEYAPKRGIGAAFEIPLSLFFRNDNGFEFVGVYPIPSVSLFYKY